MRIVAATLVGFLAGIIGAIWFYTSGGRIIAYGHELGPARVIAVAPQTPPPNRPPATAPARSANPVRTIEEEGRPTTPPPPLPGSAPPAASNVAKESPVPADALNILGIVIVWPE